MKVIIAGSRDIEDYDELLNALSGSEFGIFGISEIVSGTARGADKLGEKCALVNGIPLTRFPADWNKHGKAAGFIRNAEMAEYADALIALWDGKSRGTENMIITAHKAGLKVYVSIAARGK